MKMKVLIGASVLVIVGTGVAYCLFLKNKRKPAETGERVSSVDTEESYSDLISMSKENAEFEQNTLISKKENVATSINKRHTEAATQMRNSLTNIMNQDSVTETNNSVEFDKMISDLDRLMDDGDQKHE